MSYAGQSSGRGRPRQRPRAVRPVIELLEHRRLLAALDPYISEFLAINDHGIVDRFGNRSDWIEIHNPNAGAINLAGWHLTDDPDRLDKWTFPNTPLGPGEYLVVFASKRIETTPGQEYHTGFRLSGDRGYLALVAPDGRCVSVYDYPPQVADVSYGIGPPIVSTTRLIGSGAPARVLIPQDGQLGAAWTGLDFDDTASWTQMLTGVGYVWGNPALPSEIEPNDTIASANSAVYSFESYLGNLYHLGLFGQLSTDYFKIGDLQAGDVLTVTVAGATSRTSSYAANPAVRLYRGDTVQQTLLTTDSEVNDAGPGPDALVARYAVSVPGNHYVQVYRQSGSTRYDLGLLLENAGQVPLSSERVTQEQENNSTFAAANDLSRSWRPVQYCSTIQGTISSPSDADIYAFEFRQGDLITIHVDSTSSLDAKVSLLDSTGAVLALEDGSSVMPSPYDRDSLICAYLVPDNGTYYVKVESASGTGTYAASIYLSADTSPPSSTGWGTYGGAIKGNIGPQMMGANPSAYVRIPFGPADPAQATQLILRIRYDDGFAAYLNGTLVASRNAPETLSWDSAATAGHQAGGFEEIDITQWKHLLRADDGGNVLAIQGLNIAADDTDFLILPELEFSTVTSGQGQYFATPTPRQANQSGAMGVVADTKFSHDRGFYEAPFDLTITTETPGAEIRYTLDGSVPTALTGLLYTGPIRITRTTTVRAAAFKPGYIPTNVDTHTYLFLDDVVRQDGSGLPQTWGYTGGNIRTPPGPDYAMDPAIVSAYSPQIFDALKSIPTVSLVTSLDNWFGANGLGIYPSGSGVEKPVSIEYFTADGSDMFQIDGGVEIVGGGIGGTSADRWKSYKLSMRLSFKSIYGQPELHHDIYGPGATRNFDTLVLDAHLNWTWIHPDAGQRAGAKYIQDQYIADLQTAAGGYGPHGRFVHLYLNGIYWGMYNLHERPDEHFAREYFGGNEEDYDVIKHGIQYGAEAIVNGTAEKYQELLNRVRADLTVPANYQRVLEMLDLDAFIDYMIVNFWAGNQDWAHKNWYATYNKADPNGKWRFHSWDAEHVLRSLNEYCTTDNEQSSPTEIHTRLTANPEYRMRFADRVHRLFFNGGLLTPERAAEMYRKRVDEVSLAIIAESARWGDNRRTPAYTLEEWLATQNSLFSSYFPARSANVLRNNPTYSFVALGLYPTLDAPVFSVFGGQFPESTMLSITKNPAQAGVIYYTTDGSDPRLAGGAVNPQASVYAGTLDISESSLVKARVFNGSQWSALTEAAFLIGPPPALRVTELMYAPLPEPNSPWAADDMEFIELQNLGVSPLDIGGFSFLDGIRFTFPDDMVLQPGQRVLVVRNLDAFQYRYGTALPVAGVYQGELSDGGEKIVLATSLGQIIEEFQYKDGWYPHTDGQGYSLVANDPLASGAELSEKSLWRPSQGPGGNPGLADTGPLPNSVVISELLSHADGPEGDWIELYNQTGQEIDLSGWYLSDSEVDLCKYQIPAGTVLGAGQYLVLNQRDHFGQAGNAGVRTPFAFSELGEAAYLSGGYQGQLGGYRDSVDFGAAALGVTFGRYVKSTGASDFTALSAATPGEANAYPQVGPVVINELMYHPLPGADEFLELRNLTEQAVCLYDPQRPGNGWKLTAGVQYTFPAGAELPAGGYGLVVGIDPEIFRSKYRIGSEIPIWGPWTGMLDNAGENVELSRPGVPEPDGFVPYLVVDRVKYDDVFPWPEAANGTGASLARVRGWEYGNDVMNWQAEVKGGSPGRENLDRTPPVAEIVQVMPDPRAEAVEQIQIIFSEPVSGFDLWDLTLYRDGQVVGWTGGQRLESVDGISWVLSGMGALSWVAGRYELRLRAEGTGIVDLGQNGLAGDVSEEFQVTESVLSGGQGKDVFRLRSNGTELEVFYNAPEGQTRPTYVVPLSCLSSLLIVGGEGDDWLVLESALPFEPEFDGGAGSNTLSILGGSHFWDSQAEGLNVVVTGSDVGNRPELIFRGTQRLASLTIGGLGVVTLAAGAGCVLRTSGLAISGEGVLDLNDNDLIVQSVFEQRQAVLDSVFAFVAQARNGAADRWRGWGITSSQAVPRSAITGLAVVLNDRGDGRVLVGQLGGEPVDCNCVLVKYTWNGDMNIDGRVNADDYFRIDSGFLTQAGGYHQGDLNYDGSIDADDYFLIDSAFLAQSGPLAVGAPKAAADGGSAPLAGHLSPPGGTEPTTVVCGLFSTGPAMGQKRWESDWLAGGCELF